MQQPVIETSVVRCPHCGAEREETMPLNTCRAVYTCPECHATLRPLPGDCCVFCSYGTMPTGADPVSWLTIAATRAIPVAYWRYGPLCCAMAGHCRATAGHRTDGLYPVHHRVIRRHFGWPAPASISTHRARHHSARQTVAAALPASTTVLKGRLAHAVTSSYSLWCDARRVASCGVTSR